MVYVWVGKVRFHMTRTVSPRCFEPEAKTLVMVNKDRNSRNILFLCYHGKRGRQRRYHPSLFSLLSSISSPSCPFPCLPPSLPLSLPSSLPPSLPPSLPQPAAPARGSYGIYGTLEYCQILEIMKIAGHMEEELALR
ncbi:hypothetical protein E2C01_071572 [Portunus trituberculatus]|uniref:Uncharacterized protein n=1 Tax=Portunus trituberculatus TaxID=210409 RepID=A0A5B7I6K1_PORTR|nr:hypothetical protein [Portunus trituberculatus]